MTPERDHVLIVGYPESGKSTYVAQMSPEFLVLDFDARWEEQRANQAGKAHVIGTSDVLESLRELERRRPDLQGKVGTVIVDSGTAVLDYEQSRGRLEAAVSSARDALYQVHKNKADVMRALRLGVLKYQVNTAWIFHFEKGKLGAKDQVRSTIPATELARMKSNLNVFISIFKDEASKRRGLRIEWCRFNEGAAEGQVIWDTEGLWRGVPQKLHTFIRCYHPSSGYNQNAYSLEWLHAFLAKKGKEYPDIDAMRGDLGIETLPLWFNRAEWAKFIERAGI